LNLSVSNFKILKFYQNYSKKSIAYYKGAPSEKRRFKWIDFIDKVRGLVYSVVMILKQILLSDESYTTPNWVFKNVNVGFSRLYYILDGEAYYKENGKAVRFEKNCIYLTPVRKSFDLYENPDNKLLHTYSHVTTVPEVSAFTKIEVPENSLLADAVLLWRKYIRSEDRELLSKVIGFLLSLISDEITSDSSLAYRIKAYLDLREKSLDMKEISRDLGYTREHITRVFKAAFRVTPKQYSEMKRFGLALEKLRDGEKIGSVSHQLEFSSPYSFSKAFKKQFGYSPKQYISLIEKKNHR